MIKFLLLAGSYGGRDVSGMYSPNFGGGYMSRGNDVCNPFYHLDSRIHLLEWPSNA